MYETHDWLRDTQTDRGPWIRAGRLGTDDSAFKKQVRARMAETGENYTTARRMVIAERDPGRPPVALRVYLNPHVDLAVTDETARAYRAADEQGQRDMVNRLLADHIELGGSAEAGATAGSEILTVQELRIDEIGDAIHRLIPRAAGVATIAVSDDQDYVRIGIQAARPGVVHGHGGAEGSENRAGAYGGLRNAAPARGPHREAMTG